MRYARGLLWPGLLCIVTVFLVSMSGGVTVHAARTSWAAVTLEAGRGTAGTGSLAVTAFFSGAASSGAGGFTGRLVRGITIAQSNFGIFSLTTASSDLIPVIPCASGEVGAQGTIIAGNFTGQTVVVFSCVGSGVVGGVRIIDTSTSPFTITYDGGGTGNAKVSSSPILAGAVLAANTDGSGSAGTGSIDFTEGLVLTSDNSLPSGGGLVGTLAGAGAVTDVSSIFRIDDVSITSSTASCFSVVSSGTITSGSFAGQRVLQSFQSCVNPSLRVGAASGTLTIGTPGAIPTYRANISRQRALLGRLELA